MKFYKVIVFLLCFKGLKLYKNNFAPLFKLNRDYSTLIKCFITVAEYIRFVSAIVVAILNISSIFSHVAVL